MQLRTRRSIQTGPRRESLPRRLVVPRPELDDVPALELVLSVELRKVRRRLAAETEDKSDEQSVKMYCEDAPRDKIRL